MTIDPPRDPRLAPFALFDRLMPVPEQDAEAKAERRLLHRAELKDAVRR